MTTKTKPNRLNFYMGAESRATALGNAEQVVRAYTRNAIIYLLHTAPLGMQKTTIERQLLPPQREEMYRELHNLGVQGFVKKVPHAYYTKVLTASARTDGELKYRIREFAHGVEMRDQVLRIMITASKRELITFSYLAARLTEYGFRESEIYDDLGGLIDPSLVRYRIANADFRGPDLLTVLDFLYVAGLVTPGTDETYWLKTNPY